MAKRTKILRKKSVVQPVANDDIEDAAVYRSHAIIFSRSRKVWVCCDAANECFAAPTKAMIKGQINAYYAARSIAANEPRKIKGKIPDDIDTPALTRRLELHVVEVDDPNYQKLHDGEKHRKAKRFVNVRESSIGWLFAHKKIDLSQKTAGERFRALWERAGAKGAGAIDYAKDKVDGGGAAVDIPDAMVSAQKELDECRKVLGLKGFELMQKVAGEGYMVSDISQEQSRVKGMTYMLKEGLDTLAELWGMKNKLVSVKSRIRAEHIG